MVNNINTVNILIYILLMLLTKLEISSQNLQNVKLLLVARLYNFPLG